MSPKQILVILSAAALVAGVSIAQAPGGDAQPKAAVTKKGPPRDPAQSPAAQPRRKPTPRLKCRREKGASARSAVSAMAATPLEVRPDPT
jgi:hypothetical protein